MDVQALEEYAGFHADMQLDRVPVTIPYVPTHDIDRTALLHLAQESGPKINVSYKVAGDAHQPFAEGIDQHRSGHSMEYALVNIGGMEGGIGIEPEPNQVSNRTEALEAEAA